VLYDLLNIRIPDGYDVIGMGDHGFGFGKASYAIDNAKSHLDRINNLCKKLNITLYLIRGNHDATYDEIWKSEYSNVLLIKNSALGIFPNGKKVLFVGGGVSVDRYVRKEGNDYWKDEITPEFEINENCDIMFSHDCPEHFNHSTHSLPNHYGWYCDRDVTLIDDCLKQRLHMTDIAKRANVKTCFSGHFHNNIRQQIDGVYYRCLDINELFEFDANHEYTL
jgi:DNA repair exonuclease SbcCD nuclease subunit